MAQSDPDPEPTAAADTTPAAEAADTLGDEEKTEPADESELAEVVEKTEAEKQAEAEERSRQTVRRFLWSCAWLTVLAGVFLLAGILRSHQSLSALAWLGTALTFLSMLALIAAYVACAQDRITLRTRVLGRFDLFQVSTLGMLIAIVCGLLVPSSNKTALALLFPWALTYWMYGLDRTKTPAA
jgi:cation transport ATPase